MKVREVHLTGWCQHDDLHIEFADGVTGILGPNGSGKTNILQGIKYGLTGRCSLAGDKGANVTWGFDSGAKVEVVFEANGETGVIRRAVDKATCYLDYGGVKYRKATDVAEVIFDILGITPKILDEVVFVDQGKVDALLFTTRASDRVKMFQRLCGMEGVEVIRALLAEEIDRFVVKDYSDQIASSEASIQELSGEILKEQAKIEEAVKRLDLLDAKCKSSDVPERHRAAEEARERMQGLLKERDDTCRRLTEAQSELGKLDGNIQELSGLLESLAPSIDVSRRLIAGEEANLAASRMRSSILNDIQTYEAALKGLHEPVFPMELCDPRFKDRARESLQRESDDLATKIYVSGMMAGLDSGGAHCPFCGSKVNDVKQLIDHHKMIHQASSVKRDDLQKAIEKLDAYVQSLGAYDQEKKRLEALLAKAQINLSEVPDVTPVGDIEALRSDVSLYDESTETLTGMKSRSASLSTLQEELTRSTDKIAMMICDLETDIQDAPSKELVEQDAKDRAELESLSGGINMMQGAISAKKEELSRLTDACFKAKALQKASSEIEAWREFNIRSRNVLHRDSFPSLVVRRRLDSMNRRIASYLSVFDAKFTGKIDDDLQPMCVSDEGREFDASRLSGGEKVAFALSFVMSINRLFGDVGLVSLDEPTVFLDSDKVDCVTQLICELKEASSEANTQFIVSTHNPALLPAFDKEVML